MANNQTRHVLEYQVKQKDAQRRDELATQVKEAEERAQILASVKI